MAEIFFYIRGSSVKAKDASSTALLKSRST